MAASSRQDAANLRVITQRLTSASFKYLPVVIPQITKSLLDCKTLLSTSESLPKDSQEAILLHKYITQVTTLLNGQKKQGRWAAVVLIKATIELGDHNILSKSAAWVRGLLGILAKPDPPYTKQLSIITLTRLFGLTHTYPTLVRQITTPSLPPFVTACLNLTSNKATSASTPLLCSVLESFFHLLPDHPSIFRSFTSKIQNVVVPLLASTSESKEGEYPVTDPATVDAARSLYAVLYFCAPKSGANAEYSKMMTSLIDETHAVITQVFRGVQEDWRSLASVNIAPVSIEGEPRQTSSNLFLPDWNGIYEGSVRLQGLIALLQRFLEIETVQPVTIPLGPMIDLCTRICMVTVPSAKGSSQEASNVKVNALVTKDEREALWSQLPVLHATVFEFLKTICIRLGSAAKPIHQTLMEHVVWIFRNENYNESVRDASYDLLATILRTSAPGMTKDQIQQLIPVLKNCCNDLLPSKNSNTQNGLESTLEATLTDQKANRQRIDDSQAKSRPPIIDSALELLEISLAKIPSESVSRSTRAQLDRTAILLNESTAMLASTLNPSTQLPLEKPYSSLLPFLARSSTEDIAVEGLIRPRLPPVKMVSQHVNDGNDESSDGEDTDEPQNQMDFQFMPDRTTDSSVPSKQHSDLPEKATKTATLMPSRDDPDRSGDLPQQLDESSVQVSFPQETMPQLERQSPMESPIRLKRSTAGQEIEDSEAKKPRLGRDVQISEPQSSHVISNSPDDDDQSDEFVMPELTLEPDTDDEDDADG